MKNYQKTVTSATTPVLPEAVSIAMAELAGDPSLPTFGEAAAPRQSLTEGGEESPRA